MLLFVRALAGQCGNRGWKGRWGRALWQGNALCGREKNRGQGGGWKSGSEGVCMKEEEWCT